MKDETDIIRIVQSEIDIADYQTVTDMDIAMSYYLIKPRGDEIEGRSTVQSADISDMIESIVAQIMPSFKGGDIGQFDALYPGDEEQAEVESHMVNYMLMDRNNGYVKIQEAIRDALMFRNCIIKCYVLDKLHIITEEYEDLTEEDMVVIENTKAANEELEFIVYEDGVTLKRTIITPTLEICAVPPEEFLYTHNWNQIFLEDCPFTAHHRVVQRTDLMEMGYDKDIIDELPPSQSTGSNDYVRDDARIFEYQNNSDKSLDPIDLYECYIKMDANEDGFAEMRKIVLAGTNSNKILENIEVQFNAFAGGAAMLFPHRFKAVSIYDKAKEVQDAKTFILRQYQDNINVMNNRRLEAEMPNIMDPNDLVESRAGGIIKVRRLGSVREIEVSDIGPSCITALNYWDKIRTERCGASLDMQAENMPVGVAETAHGAERIISSKEQIASLIAGTIKNTLIKSLFLLIHKTIKRDIKGELIAKIDTGWLQTNPEQWKDRATLKINTSDTAGENNRKSAALGMILQQQTGAFQMGGDDILVDLSKIHSTVTDFARASGLDHPGKYWINPQSKEAQQAREGKKEQAAKDREDQFALQKAIGQAETLKAQVSQMSASSKAIIDGLKQKLDTAKAAAEAAAKDQNLIFDYTKHYDDLAMQLTGLEVQYATAVKEMEFKENKEQVT